ncbi:hypothetical protein Naga_100525g3 [Nannochloropsis gaditana]|uniref:Uncharacterized protein n=1 Tax=Nannochloropsis gaditana TaxID=72520 RepID=W7TJ07_9STRA|nr:hypothetical protein Naga_100525g3 [Nannochloropsis gaditana]
MNGKRSDEMAGASRFPRAPLQGYGCHPSPLCEMTVCAVFNRCLSLSLRINIQGSKYYTWTKSETTFRNIFPVLTFLQNLFLIETLFTKSPSQWLNESSGSLRQRL